MPDILAFDLGGSSLRVAVVAENGSLREMVRRELRITHDGQQRFEADPHIWWAAFQDACAELSARGCDLAATGAVAGCGFTRTQVFLDEHSEPIRPAITFQDSRSAAMLDDLRTSASDPVRDIVENLSPFDPLARLLWLQRHEPECWARLRKVVEPKDFLNLMLTGVAVSDTISQASMTRSLGQDGKSVLTNLGIERSLLPQMLSPFDRVGEVRSGLPQPLSYLAGTTVYCGSLDTWSCVLGSGALTPGAAYSISGTSDVFGVITTTKHAADGLLSGEWGPGIWQLGGPSQGAASRLQWALDRFMPGTSMDTALKAALASDRAAPLFLPYLDGERTPWWDPNLRGAFLSLEHDHDAADLLRGVAEGINYLAREVLSRAEQATGRQVEHVFFSGGLAGNSALCQLT